MYVCIVTVNVSGPIECRDLIYKQGYSYSEVNICDSMMTSSDHP